MNRQDVALVPLGQLNEGRRWRLWLPVVGVRGRVELAAPYGSIGAAAKLCTAIGRFRLTCQPTIFAGRHFDVGLEASLIWRPGRERSIADIAEHSPILSEAIDLTRV